MYEKFDDYQEQANAFCSPSFFGESFPLSEFVAYLETASRACEKLDLFKRALFYDNREKYALESHGDSLILPDQGDQDIVHSILGILTEAGEIGSALVEALDKYRDNPSKGLDIDRVNVREELGDGLWYAAIGARGTGGSRSLSNIAEKNISKLSARYPGAVFTAEKALNRDHKAEREILEAK
jgi:NTP pyrophosphatase (non-canonical NTP hydrolase)